MAKGFKNTAGVWDFLKPRLLGSWHRLEAIHPDGLGDAVGFHSGLTHWLEIKVHPDQLRPAQIAMMQTAGAYGVFFWVVRAKGARLTWHRGLMIAEATIMPSFLKQ